MSQTYTWLVTGTSRGIGLELVRQLLTDPSNIIIATCRNPTGATALKSLKNGAKGELHVVQLDITDEDSVRNSVTAVEQILGHSGLDYLVNNAAVSNGLDTAFDFSLDAFKRILPSNIVGPALMSQTYLPLLLKGNRKVLVNVSSGLGSLTLNIGKAEYATYSVTKAALNMLTFKQAQARPEIIAITLCPGWVKTEMGTQDAPLEVHESVAGIIKVVTSLQPEDSGRYWRYNGEEIPW
ncbi:C-factor [Obba rivulosa]|uniref:C-factor n=1 Tax=Obba rivulosa TaxID=1052685 RepID=A0A8E2AJ53_9APHY|nr:C-factor [Obba rivulosa]